jgi:hypothetical protein
MTPPPPTKLDSALAYAKLGLYVFPLKLKGKAPLGVLVRKGKDEATCDPVKIRAWWGSYPDANIGINCAMSGIAVVDIDCHAGKANGFDTLSALENEHGPLWSPVVAQSGSGGEHRYFRAPPGIRLPGQVGPGIDLKHNGYIVVPPSVHPDGPLYAWRSGCSPFEAPQMPLLPEWVFTVPGKPASAALEGSALLPNEVARACSALFSLDAGCDRPTWIRRAMAAKDASVPYEVFHVWSTTGWNYTNEKDCRSAWNSFKDDKDVRITAATLFHEAHKAGWQDPAKMRDGRRAEARRYRMQSPDDLLNAPPLRWLVRGVLPATGLASLYGPTGSGKSFLALALCAAIAEGADWFGRRVDAAPVTYLCLEGEAGMGKRVKAWREHHERALPDRLRFVTQSFNLGNAADIEDLCAAVLETGWRDGLVVIDTLNRATPGADENASTDMGQIIEACKEIQRLIGGVVLVVHHTGKDATKGLRGHSSLFAALDAVIEVKRDGERRDWFVAKSKDDADGAGNAFQLAVVDIGEDDDGELVTSCVVEPVRGAAPVAVRRLGPTQRIVHEVMQMLLRESPDAGKAGAPAGRPCVREEEAVPVIAERVLCEPSRRKTMVRRALSHFFASGIYQFRDGWIWAP